MKKEASARGGLFREGEFRDRWPIELFEVYEIFETSISDKEVVFAQKFLDVQGRRYVLYI